VVKLGCWGGNFASVLLPAIDSITNVEKVGVASAAGVSARRAADRHSFRYASGDEAQVLNDPEVNTVAILTRHHLHARQVLAALSAGKHVFVEKPLAVSEEELRKIEELLSVISHQSSVTSEQLPVTNPQPPGKESAIDKLVTGHWPLVTVGFNRRFAPLALRLKGFLNGRQEPLVAHYRVNAGYLPPAHWLNDPEQGGGRIIGEGCHFVDFLAFLVGEPPISVTAQGLPDGGRYCEDNVVLTFGFPDGSLGTITYLANGDKSFPKERVEVFAAGRVGVLTITAPGAGCGWEAGNLTSPPSPG
jgi:predicted dehydrogenase